MVKRYNIDGPHDDRYMDPNEDGFYVEYDDYLALQSALKEALEGWEAWMPGKRSTSMLAADGRKRIAELRKQFLEDK